MKDMLLSGVISFSRFSQGNLQPEGNGLPAVWVLERTPCNPANPDYIKDQVDQLENKLIISDRNTFIYIETK